MIRSLPFYNLFKLTNHPEPQIRGLALRLFGNMKAREIRAQIEALNNDTAPVVLYRDGKELRLSVGELATAALSQIDA